MENTRESRRRKILDRGGDRLAFISGQTQSVPDSSYSTTPRPRPPSAEDYPQTPFASHSRGEGSISSLSDQYTSEKDDTGTAGERAEIHQSDRVPKNLGSDEILDNNKGDEKALQSDRDSVPLITSTPRSSSDPVGGTSLPTAKVKKPLLLSSKQVKHVVSISEDKRLLFAVTIALLVVMSNQGYAFGGAIGRSLVYFGPLFLVMLTDLTIILCLLMTTRQGDDKTKEAAKTGNEAYGWAAITLEALLMFQKVTSAIFMDCGICAVIIISGLFL